MCFNKITRDNCSYLLQVKDMYSIFFKNKLHDLIFRNSKPNLQKCTLKTSSLILLDEIFLALTNNENLGTDRHIAAFFNFQKFPY